MPLLPHGALRPALFAGLVLAATAVPAACSSSNTVAPPVSTADGGDAGPATGATPVARFVLGAGTTPPNFLDVPFPTDAYLANGSVLAQIPGLDQQVPGDTNYIEYGLSQLNGFSRVALAMFAVDDPGVDGGKYAVASAAIDPTTLPVAETDCTKATSSVYIVDLAPGATTPLLPCRAAFHSDRPRAPTNPVVVVGPPRGYLLEEGHPYAIVLTSRVKDTNGHAVTASADFAGVAAGTAPGAIGAAYVTAYKTASAALATSLAGDHATIVSLAAFTTMKKSNELFAMRDALESAPAPKLAWDADAMAPMSNAKFAAVSAAPVDAGPGTDAGADSGADAGTDDGGSDDAGPTAPPDAGSGVLPPGFTASLDDWLGVVPATAKLPSGIDDPDTQLGPRAHDKIAAVGSAIFSATSYLQVKPTGYADPAHASFAYDDAGVPIVQGKVPIWITFVVPKAPMPATGYPTVIVQHGLDGSREYILAIANTFAAQGWLVAGIDSITFGARAPESDYQVDKVTNFGGPGTGATYAGPDGFADDPTNGSTDLFGGLQSILSIRDQFREAGFDTAQVVKVLRSSPDLSPLATGGVVPVIDGSKIAYVGDSLGAMEGTIAAAIEPHVSAWFLNVNAGSLFPELAAHSPAIGSLLSEAAGLNFGIAGNVFDWSNPLMQILGDRRRAGGSDHVRPVPLDEPAAARRPADGARGARSRPR